MKKIIYCLIICFLLSAAFVWGQADSRTPGGMPGAAFNSMQQSLNPEPMSLEDEYYLGRAVAAGILTTYKPYTANPALTTYLNQICQALVINSAKPVVFNGYFVVIIDTMEYNAFASPAGHIMLSRGLIEAANSEDALAGLIAHELAHVELRHAAAMIDEMSFSNEMGQTAQRAAAFSGNQAAQRALQLRNSVSGIVDTMIKNGFSREQELAADRRALDLLAATGYDPRGLVEMLQILQRVQTGQKGGFNSTHPAPSERITSVNSIIVTFKVQDTRASRKQRFINK